VLLISSCVVIH